MSDGNHNSAGFGDGDPTDEALMARVAARDKDAFAMLVRRHQRELVNFFRRMGDYTDADDLTQETFVRLFRYRKRYRPTAKFTTFLYLLARRAWIDHRRRVERRGKAYEALAVELAARRDTVDSGADARARAVEALDALSKEMRLVVVMSVYQGLTLAEIAEALDIPLGTAKTRMFYAMRKLKESMGHERRN